MNESQNNFLIIFEYSVLMFSIFSSICVYYSYDPCDKVSQSRLTQENKHFYYFLFQNSLQKQAKENPAARKLKIVTKATYRMFLLLLN